MPNRERDRWLGERRMAASSVFRSVSMLGASLLLAGASRAGEGRAAPRADSRRADLSFSERVEAQRSIERVYYAHLAGAARPFDEAVPQSLLENKVRKALQESIALETIWNTPVTSESLQGEW